MLISNRINFFHLKFISDSHTYSKPIMHVEKSANLQIRAEMQTYLKLAKLIWIWYRPQYQKLVEQNRKLKNELKELAKAADEALQRERQNRAVKKNRDEEPELKGTIHYWWLIIFSRKDARIERTTC